MKKGKVAIIALFAVLIMLMSVVSASATAIDCGFDDISDSDSDRATFETICYTGIFQGSKKGEKRNLYPDKLFNRAEFATVLNRFAAVSGDEQDEYIELLDGTLDFVDLEGKLDAWYIVEIKNATNGYGAPFKGYSDGTFRPAQAINFAELAKTILVQAKRTEMATFEEKLIPTDVWFEVYLKFLEKHDIIKYNETSQRVIFGGKIFTPDKQVSRRIAIQLLYELAAKRLIKFPDFERINKNVLNKIAQEKGSKGAKHTYANGVVTIVKNTTKQGGTIGKEVHILPQKQEPEDWLIDVQTEWILNSDCAFYDSFPLSTGNEYDEGAKLGRSYGFFDKEMRHFPVSDSTPPPGSTKEFAAGYIYGYEAVHNGSLVPKTGCQPQVNVYAFNRQGWLVSDSPDLPFTIALPPRPYVTGMQTFNPLSPIYHLEKEGKTVGSVKRFGLDFENNPIDQLEPNLGRQLNIEAIHFAELNIRESLKKQALDFFNATKQSLKETVPETFCLIDNFNMEEKKIGSTQNDAVSLSFTTICPIFEDYEDKDGYVVEGAVTFNIVGSSYEYYFVRLNNGNTVFFVFENNADAGDEVGEIIPEKRTNRNFIEQFMRSFADKTK